MKHIKKIGATAAITGAALTAGMVSSTHNVKADTVPATNQSQNLHNNQQSAAAKSSSQTAVDVEKSKIASAQSRVDQTKPAADAAQDKINSAQSTVNADQSKVNQAQSAVNSANQQISQKKTTIASDQSKVASIKSEISNAQQNLPTAQQSAQAASQQAQQAQNKANAAKAAMDSAQSKVDDLTNQKNQTQDKINSLSQGTNLPAAQKAVSDAQSAVSNAQSKLSNDQNTLNNLNNQAKNNVATDQYGHQIILAHPSKEQEAEWDNGVTLSQNEQEMLDEINAYRMAQGIPPLKVDANLETLARQRSQALQTDFNHDGPSTVTLTNGVTEGYSENIASGGSDWNTDGYAPVLAWLMNDPNGFSHRTNCLDPSVQYIGVGFTNGWAAADFAAVKRDLTTTQEVNDNIAEKEYTNGNQDATYTGPHSITPIPLSEDNGTLPSNNGKAFGDLDYLDSLTDDSGKQDQITMPDPSLPQKIQDAQNAVNNDQANLTAAQNQLTNAQNALNAAEESASQKAAQIKNLQNTLNNINSELNNAQDALNQAKNNYNSAESAAQTAQANADKLNNEVKQMQDALSNGQNEINQLENQIKQLENTPDPDVATLQNDLTNAQNALKDAQAALAQAKQDGAAPIAAYNQALNDLKNAEAQLNQAEQEAAAQKRAQEIAAANQAHRDLDGTALPAGAYIKPNGDIISATGKLIGKDGILFGNTAHFASDINNGTTLKSGTKVYFGNSNTVEAAEVPTKNVAKKTLPDTGDAQNTKAEEAGIVALGLAGIASAFGFAKRKKRD